MCLLASFCSHKLELYQDTQQYTGISRVQAAIFLQPRENSELGKVEIFIEPRWSAAVPAPEAALVRDTGAREGGNKLLH